MSNSKTCFVIMGFGKKTDYGNATRTLDLDATYEAIIKPAVKACQLQCVRADEIKHSGVIDTPMYRMLRDADLVIADISTANANALYELGVRHALRPRATILIKEQDGAFHFDLNHLATLQYKHLGEDIGTREAATKRDALALLIQSVLANDEIDSPVFTFLGDSSSGGSSSGGSSSGGSSSGGSSSGGSSSGGSSSGGSSSGGSSSGGSKQGLTGAAAQERTTELATQGNALGEVLGAARAAAKSSNHAAAKKYFAEARDLMMTTQNGAASSPDPFVIQQLALATYKDESEEPLIALQDAWRIIGVLSPSTSTDPETLGIAGAIQKRLWLLCNKISCLNQSIELYGRGFEVKRDYYNGENYATCLDLRAAHQADPDEAAYDRKTAQKVRARIIDSLEPALAEPGAPDRRDYRWMLATLANTLHALGRSPEANPYELRFRRLQLADWELATFEQGKKYALDLYAARSKP